MSWRKKEQEARVEMIRAIAQSQQAMARILNCVADSAERLPLLEQAIGENIRVLANMQQTMAEMIAGVPLRKQMYGKPSKPWLLEAVEVYKNKEQ
ncbi:hypothetical protein [Paenibacillus sp. GCM10027626]|uniref:hypothetical protein n=1 Tax=Paenibacillus sp. GCM10027626 TaxID=3273411 RepID=UPI003642AB59